MSLGSIFPFQPGDKLELSTHHDANFIHIMTPAAKRSRHASPSPNLDKGLDRPRTLPL
jgi:hypothetical protein